MRRKDELIDEIKQLKELYDVPFTAELRPQLNAVISVLGWVLKIEDISPTSSNIKNSILQVMKERKEQDL